MSKLFPCHYEHATNNMVKYGRGQQEKMMDFDYHEEYLKGVYHTKYYYGSVKHWHVLIQF